MATRIKMDPFEHPLRNIEDSSDGSSSSCSSLSSNSDRLVIIDNNQELIHESPVNKPNYVKKTTTKRPAPYTPTTEPKKVKTDCQPSTSAACYNYAHEEPPNDLSAYIDQELLIGGLSVETIDNLLSDQIQMEIEQEANEEPEQLNQLPKVDQHIQQHVDQHVEEHVQQHVELNMQQHVEHVEQHAQIHVVRRVGHVYYYRHIDELPPLYRLRQPNRNSFRPYPPTLPPRPPPSPSQGF